MEDLYIIRKAHECEMVYSQNPIVTDSELRRRLAVIAPMDLTYHDGQNAVDDKDIYYLLYGVWPKKD